MRFDFIHTHTHKVLSPFLQSHTQSRDTNSNNNNNERRAIISKTHTKKAKDDMCESSFLYIEREREILIKSDIKGLLPPPFFPLYVTN